MSQKTRAQLEALRDSLIRSNGVNGKTRASDVRTFETAIIESLLNILDDADENGGFLQVNSGRVDVGKINSAAPAGKYLRDEGAWVEPFMQGNKIVNGDGATTVFAVTHGFGTTPSGVFITPLNEVSSEQHWVENIGLTTFDIVFKVAPVVGVLNVRFKYLVA